MARHPVDPIVKSVTDLAWMEGRWAGTRGADKVEEHWSGPDAKTLMGMFRWIRDGNVKFFELLAIEEEDGSPIMRIKHFYPGLKGWEEKDDSVVFDLVYLDGPQATWSKRGDAEGKWLLYERAGDSLWAWFEKPDEIPNPSGRFAYELQG